MGEQLDREIERLEARLDGGRGPSGHQATRVVDELATVRRGLASPDPRGPAVRLPNLRLGFACKERWEDMVGDDRVRACGGCDRPVFNLSAMTQAEAEAVLATRGLTPCVRFYRRPDGTIMNTDCPSGAPQRRRLAVVASSLAAGATLAAPSSAFADPDTSSTTSDSGWTAAQPGDAPSSDAPSSDAPTDDPPVTDDHPVVEDSPVELMGEPIEHEMGEIEVTPTEKRSAVEWSVWARLGSGIASRELQEGDAIARTVTPPADRRAVPILEAALAVDVTFRLALEGDLRIGPWGEIRTSSGPVVGGELVLDGLPPHPYSSRLQGTGSVVVRVGANAHVVTTQLGFGYVGWWPSQAWVHHVVGARMIASMNRSTDDPQDWSVTFGLEFEPLGVLHGLANIVRGR